MKFLWKVLGRSVMVKIRNKAKREMVTKSIRSSRPDYSKAVWEDGEGR